MVATLTLEFWRLKCLCFSLDFGLLMITVFCKWALSHFYLGSKWDFSQYFDGHCSLFRVPSQLTGNHIFSRQDRRCVTGRLLRTEEYLGWAAGLNLLLCSWCLQMRRSAAQPPATRASRQAVTLVTLQPPPMAAAHHQLSAPSPLLQSQSPL